MKKPNFLACAALKSSSACLARESLSFGAGEFRAAGFENVCECGYVHGLVPTKERRIL
jgi:hypothetical protein